MASRKSTRKDHTGEIHGKLLLLRFVHTNKWQHSIWLCRCSCGVEKEIDYAKIAIGRVVSCGCYNRTKSITHGMSVGYQKVYQTWKHALQRCARPGKRNRHIYADRGITVCDEWKNDFPAFLAYIGYPPSDKHTIDRIDNDRGYEPGNVRWATMREQTRNLRTNVNITINGETMCQADWAEKLGVCAKTVMRHHRNGTLEVFAARRNHSD